MKYVVAYAKIQAEKVKVTLNGIYYGGLGDSKENAHIIASECVNSVKGGTIIPQIHEINDDGNIIDALYDIADKFDRMIDQMNEVNNMINRGVKRR